MTRAAPAPAVADLKTVALSPRLVRALPAKAKARLKLPPAAQATPSLYALTASQVTADERPHTIITTLDVDTGEVTSYDRPEPLPWFAPETRGEIGIAHGLRNGQPMGRLSLRQDLLQVKRIHLGGQASVDQDGEWFAGVGIWYRW